MQTDKSAATLRRHETCLSSNGAKSQIKYLRDKITCKLSPASKKKGETLPRIKVTKMVSAKPTSKSTITSTLTATKDVNAQLNKIRSKTNVSSKSLLVSSEPKTCSNARKPCRSCSLYLKDPVKASGARSKLGSLGNQRKKLDVTFTKAQKEKLTKSPDLVSPNEVKRAVTKQLGSSPKTTRATTSSVSIPERVKGVSLSRPPTPAQRSTSGSIEKLTVSKKKVKNSAAKKSESDQKSLKKKGQSLSKEVKCAGRAAGTEIIKKLKIMEDEEALNEVNLKEIQKQREIVQSNSFFQHLLLGANVEHVFHPQRKDKHALIQEKAEQLRRKLYSSSEPSIDACRIYLQHIKPVTESKFRSLTLSSVRSRSISPSSSKQTYSPYEDTSNYLQMQKRSISLPPKLTDKVVSQRKSPIRHTQVPLARSSSDLARSLSSIDSLDKYGYQCYIKELVSSNRASSKFKELSRFYSRLERMGQLELTTSAAEVRPRRRSEDEIIDYDRWKEVKNREKAERELEMVYFRLKTDQKEKGLLFRPKDVESFRWKKELDRGLRIKDKSVENIKEAFEKLSEKQSDLETTKLRMLNYQKDIYKPHWRGSSVLSLANQITEKRSLSESRVPTLRQGRVDSERSLLTRGVGSRIWSSLSLEQVNVLRNQLTEIYGQTAFKHLDYKSDHQQSIPETPRILSRERDERKCETAMSENQKKQLSQSLSTEVLNHFFQKQQRYKTSVSLVLGKETRGAVAASEARTKPNCPESPRTCYSLELSDDGKFERERKHKDNEFVLVLAKNDSHKGDIKETLQEWAQPKKALVKTDAVSSPPKVSSESGSTDDSAKTVVYVDTKDDVQKKVQYFEQSAKANTYVPTVYKPAGSDDTGNVSAVSSKQSSHENLSSSQSYQDLTQYFGERELVRFATLPLSAIRKQTTTVKEKHSKPNGRSEPVYRSRSLSPYFGEAYSLVRTGDVNRLKNRFESMSRQLRRWKSDSYLSKKSQNTGMVDLLRRNYEYPAIAGRGRSRSRRGGVVSPVFLRAEDRLMPHINIISKIANLYARRPTSSLETSKSTEELAAILGCPVGEVEKMRQKFDSISLLGHLFTSSPNIHELRDIAPHLAAEWAAHRYPFFHDNARSLSSPESSPASRDLPLRKYQPRPKSASPSLARKAPSSILKTPEKLVVKSDRPRTQPLVHKAWLPSTSAHSKPSVTFKGVI